MISTEIISKILKDSDKQRAEYLRLNKAYLCEALPIFGRTKEKNSEICNKINNDFRGTIVQSITGYMAGQPIGYEYYSENETEQERFNELWGDIASLNNIEATDTNLVELMSATGVTHRLLWIDGEAEINILNLNPWEAVLTTIDGLPAAIRVIPQGQNISLIEVYDSTFYTTYEADNNTWSLKPVSEERAHGFSYVPIVEFANNKDKQSDFARVEALIDAYDTTVSNVQDESDQHRAAILIAKGGKIGLVEAKEIRESGVANLPDDAELNYLLKTVDTAFTDSHLSRIEQNIFRFAQIVDFTSERFAGGAVTGEALKRLLLPMENKAKRKERQLIAGFRKQFELIFDLWQQKHNEKFDLQNLQFQFTRNLPPDLTALSQTIGGMRGLVSDRTLLGQVPFVEDVEKEIEQVAVERESRIDLRQFDDSGNDNNDSGGNDDNQ